MSSKKKPFPLWVPSIEKRVRTVVGLPKFFFSSAPPYAERIEALHELLPLLEEKSFIYRTKEERNTGRTVLLDCWEALLKRVDLAVHRHRKLFYVAILYLIRRHEFDVRSIGIDRSYRLSGSPLEEKLVQRFTELLYRTLGYIIEKLNRSKGPFSYARDFCIKGLASLFFYINNLDQLILAAVWTKDEERASMRAHPIVSQALEDLIDEDTISAHSSPLHASPSTTRSRRSLDVIIPVERLEIFCIAKQVLAGISTQPFPEAALLTSSANSDWLRHFSAKQDFYLEFVDSLVQFVGFQVPEGTAIDWHLVPGYYLLLHSFFHCFRELLLDRPPNIPNVFLDLTESLLTGHPSVISPLMRILLGSTVVHKHHHIIDSLDVMDIWIEALPNSQLPPGFDYKFLTKVFHILLMDEHFDVLSRTLRFCYVNLAAFEEQARFEFLCRLVLDPVIFVRLMLHWDSHIQLMMCYLILYRLHSITPPPSLDEDILLLIQDLERPASTRSGPVSSRHASYSANGEVWSPPVPSSLPGETQYSAEMSPSSSSSTSSTSTERSRKHSGVEGATDGASGGSGCDEVEVSLPSVLPGTRTVAQEVDPPPGGADPMFLPITPLHVSLLRWPFAVHSMQSATNTVGIGSSSQRIIAMERDNALHMVVESYLEQLTQAWIAGSPSFSGSSSLRTSSKLVEEQDHLQDADTGQYKKQKEEEEEEKKQKAHKKAAHDDDVNSSAETLTAFPVSPRGSRTRPPRLLITSQQMPYLRRLLIEWPNHITSYFKAHAAHCQDLGLPRLPNILDARGVSFDVARDE